MQGEARLHPLYGKNNPPPSKNAPKKSAQVLYVPSGPASSSVEVPALAKAVATAVKTAIGEAQREATQEMSMAMSSAMQPIAQAQQYQLQLQQAYQNQTATHQQLVDNLRGISQMIETNASWMRIGADPRNNDGAPAPGHVSRGIDCMPRSNWLSRDK